ncbi:MAG: hypothetical protein LBJ96_05450, partial [Holosporaceae bacterium]|nr:hypothetical protein [Holosporaceae bacterium]
HYHDPDLEKLEDNHKKIRYGECETYAEWVSDVLYSAAFYAYDAFSKASKASDESENNCFRDDYVRSLLEEQRKNYKKKRNYKFSRIRKVKTETEF